MMRAPCHLRGLCAGLIVLWALGSGGGCKRRATLAPVVFEADDSETAVLEGVDAPLWPPPGRAALENGALVYWYHEAEAQGFHLRLCFPTGGPDGRAAAADVLVVARLFESDLRRELKRYDTRVAVEFAPGRFEVVLAGPSASLASVVKRLARTLSDTTSERALARAQGRAVAQYHPPDHAEWAMVDLTARLLDLPVSSQVADKRELAEADLGHLEDARRRLTDPRSAVVVLHTALNPSQGGALLGMLGSHWSSRSWGGGTGELHAVTRLLGYGETVALRGGDRLLGTPAAPLWIVPSSGSTMASPATLVLGRLIPTPTAVERGMARLAQRVIQEELDARLVISGPVSLFVVRVPLSRRDARKSVQRVVDQLAKLVEAEHPRWRLEEAARLWLGARMVEASLGGEDWTALWSESVGLSNSDDEIPRALAEEARLMLDTSPESLGVWMKAWLHPHEGEAGWTWSVSGADEDARQALRVLTPLRDGEVRP
ncbi:MAG: hypothetical protein V3V08_22550 [Nannocystaceae bacterium]